MNNHQTQILENVSGATSSIKLAVSWLTDSTLLRKLIDKANLGTSVKILLSADDFNLTRFYDLKKLEEAGAVLKKIGSKNALDGHFMHAKLLIVDNKKAFGGSYNWTNNAQSNYEAFDEFVNPQNHIADFDSWFSNAESLLSGITLSEVERRLKALELEYKEVTFQAKVLSPNASNVSLNDHICMISQKQEKAHKLETTANHIANGSLAVNKQGQPAPATSGVSSKPHRYHGGGFQMAYSDRQCSPFAAAHFQKYFINKHFTFLRSRIENGKLICRGQLQPEGCSSYDVKIEFTAGYPPIVKIVNLKVESKFEVHMYDCGSLCLYYPADMKWKDHTKISEYTIPWITEWIYYYEVWKLTGQWKGPESPAHIKE